MRIESHPRGIAISLTNDNSRTTVLRQVEKRLGDLVLIQRDKLVVPITAGADVLDLFGTDDAEWDAKLLKQVRVQIEHRNQQLRARIEVAAALDDPAKALAGYEPISQLDHHQIEAVAAVTVPSLKGVALFDEQGAGKTISALASFDRLVQLGRVRRVLVVTPKSVIGSWLGDCNKLFGDKYRVVVAHGTARQRRTSIQREHDILLVGYETARQEKGLLQMIVAAIPLAYMLVIDESYFVKNPEAARSRAVAEVRTLVERALILCGTPAPNSPLDIVNQINIADGGVVFGNVSIPGDSEEAEQVIRDRLGEVIYLRRLKEDVLPDIPGKEFVRVSLGLQPIQHEMYEEARKDLVFRVRSVDDREFARNLSSFIARRVTLLQLCSNPVGIDPLYTETPAKLLALDKLLTELIDQQKKKVVIWSFFRDSLQAIFDRYENYGVVRIDGTVANVEERINAIERFQNDITVRLFIGNAAAAGTGITLTAAHHAIYESFSNQAAHYMQSMDRIHRRGQTEDVTYHVLLSRDTIEEREFDRLVRKERLGRDLLGDHYEEPMTRERFLAELGEANEH